MASQPRLLEVRPTLPPNLVRLQELAGNLIYSWDRNIRRLFYRLDPWLWESCRHTPVMVLRRISQARLDAVSRDPDFLKDFQDALRQFDAYMAEQPWRTSDPQAPHVAYLCMEYGIHESVHLYSGGLGILAGDYCKSAGYGPVPFTAVGLMYRHGYFEQRIDAHGDQQVRAHAVDPETLPLQLERGADGQPLQVPVPLPGRTVMVRIWRAQVGRTPVYLLDADTPDNAAQDRAITQQLYGGDRPVRIAQELILGVGGVRALRALQREPQLWHLNEGHPAFAVLALCEDKVRQGIPFDTALEAVAASVVFTTHTPVDAGHDRFDRDLAMRHLAALADALHTPTEHLFALGISADEPDSFNMTTLALRGSRHCNGVSRIHGQVASRMSRHVWPQIEPEDNPMQYVTNGVHVPTFLAREWCVVFDHRYSAWRSRLRDAPFWRQMISDISDQRFWSLRRSLRGTMLGYVSCVLERQYTRMNLSRSRIEHMRHALCEPDNRALVIGFARRFTSYKRPLLLFRDLPRLERLLTDPQRPIQLLFAGKAHPQDGPGQEMIRQINHLAARPPFLGRLFFIEDYDMALARKLVTGVDLWLNNPDHPLEASGTSGQKAAINGVINLSVLDGWWAEGYEGDNGWAVMPHEAGLTNDQRDDLACEDLMSLLEEAVLPDFHRREPDGVPLAWVARAKASMWSCLPRFNTDRMLADYVQQMYLPAAQAAQRLAADGAAMAHDLLVSKRRVGAAWGSVGLRWAQMPAPSVGAGQAVPVSVWVNLGGLSPQDLRVECVLEDVEPVRSRTPRIIAMQPRQVARDEWCYEAADLAPPDGGLFSARVRAYPCHPGLTHPFETGRMLWLQ